MPRARRRLTALLVLLQLAGCGSLFRETAAVTAGVGGAALAARASDNAAVATGIGLGCTGGSAQVCNMLRNATIACNRI
ncbi:MAG: hypothetical protein WAT67_03915 [Candidatus Contendobacter sp.]